MTLKETAVGQTVKVKKLTGECPVKRRIMDMGITKGVDVFVRKVAPLGDPIEVTVRGYELSLRKADAEMIAPVSLFTRSGRVRSPCLSDTCLFHYQVRLNYNICF